MVQSIAATTPDLTIAFDAATGSYTVQTEGRSKTFSPSQEMAQRWDGERRFSDGSDYLTIVTNPYSGAEYSNRYVGMGYWQRNAVGGGTQQTYFTTFTFGLNSPDSSIPRTGAAHWLTDIFGVLTIPGEELRVVQGLGDFAVDFSDGTFVSHANLNEANVLTLGGANGSLRFESGGFLTANGFRGLFSYNGIDTRLQGALEGSFYGPNSEEIGAAFAASGIGASLTGALTGQKFPVGSTSDGIKNISLTNVLADFRSFGQTIRLHWERTPGSTDYRNIVGGMSTGHVDFTTEGIKSIGAIYGYTPNPADIDPAGPANFTTYRTTIQGVEQVIRVYEIGGENSELALTYASFIDWRSGTPETNTAYATGVDQSYLVYGLQSSVELMEARTGSATYSGVVYGAGASMNGNSYDIGGTSEFAVDFSGDTYAGWLQLDAVDASGVASDFGQWDFAGVMSYGGMIAAPLTGQGTYDPGSSIEPTFFGPTGQEIGATFSLGIGWPPTRDTIDIVGITVAKER